MSFLVCRSDISFKSMNETVPHHENAISSKNHTLYTGTAGYQVMFYMEVYAGLVAGATILYILRYIMVICFLNNCSKNLHNMMFEHVMTAPTRFFDTNPVGE